MTSKATWKRDLRPQVRACDRILRHFGAMLSVHSADGVDAATGKGTGVDAIVREETGGQAELKVADVYQEVLWQVLAASPEPAERALFGEAWQRTLSAVRTLALVYQNDIVGRTLQDVQRDLSSVAGQERIRSAHGDAGLLLAQGTVGYGLPVFRLASNLLATTDPAQTSPSQELFRRFMFLTFRDLRPLVFEAMSHEGWGGSPAPSSRQRSFVCAAWAGLKRLTRQRHDQ